MRSEDQLELLSRIRERWEVFPFLGSRLVLMRPFYKTGYKRAIFTHVTDSEDANELWISFSPTKVRLFPRNAENYYDNTIFGEPVRRHPSVTRSAPLRTWTAFHFHKEFFDDCVKCFGEPEVLGEAYNDIFRIKYDFDPLKGKWRWGLGCFYEILYALNCLGSEEMEQLRLHIESLPKD